MASTIIKQGRWAVVSIGGEAAFDLSNDQGQTVRFKDEADSHAAGEAVRAFLGRPRVSEVIAEKEKTERELAAVRAERDSLRLSSRRELDAAEQRAADIESGKLGVEKLAVSAALHAEKQKTARLEEALAQARLDVRDNGERLRQLNERVTHLEAEAIALAGRSPSNDEVTPS